jgi:hypothetical protein
MTAFPFRRINIVGAPGSGTSTLACALATAIGGRFIDADDFYWKHTDPPFKDKVDAATRLSTLLSAMEGPNAGSGSGSLPAVVAGSVCGWGEPLETALDLVVFLSVPTPLRMQRIEARECARFGHADPAFMAWAAQYDEGVMPGRSRARHEAWLGQLTCRVMRFDGDQPVQDRVQAILQAAARHAC